MATQLEGPAREELATPDPYPRLMRPRFLDPLSPPGDISSIALMPGFMAHRVSNECVVHEHDDRRAESLAYDTNLTSTNGKVILS
ncbi:MAG: hypothetical protein MPJ50_12105 [Pirellulales bacterium]|nr:hypothetical protein [Pirellulales bacterium]